jgi:hypothetical protein
VCREIPVDEAHGHFDKQIEFCESFWKTQFIYFPELSRLARFAMTIAPSSGAPERSFSLLKNSFSLAQIRASLMDYITASVMAQYNDREGNKM